MGAAIQSVFEQDFEGGIEVIVVNDGSTDGTARVLEAFGGRIRIVGQENRGLAAARNAGASAGSGAFLAFLDADDNWRSDKLTKTVARLQANPAAVLAYSDLAAVDEAGRVVASPIASELAHAPSMDELLVRWWPILPSTVVMRREAFERSGGFCEQFRRAYEDVDLWLRGRELGEFEYIAAPLVRYRTRPVENRMERYEADYPAFRRRVRERYGSRGRKLVQATQRAYVAALGHRGIVALRAGDVLTARRLLLRALGYRPFDVKTSLRLMRTFLPRPVALAFSRRSRQAAR